MEFILDKIMVKGLAIFIDPPTVLIPFGYQPKKSLWRQGRQDAMYAILFRSIRQRTHSMSKFNLKSFRSEIFVGNEPDIFTLQCR